jgi:hypothetical protein
MKKYKDKLKNKRLNTQLKEKDNTPFKAWYDPIKDKLIKFDIKYDHSNYGEYEDLLKNKKWVRLFVMPIEIGIETWTLPNKKLLKQVSEILKNEVNRFKIKRIYWDTDNLKKTIEIKPFTFFNLLEESIKFKDLKKGQIITLNPNAECYYSYKPGTVPKKYLKNNTWVIDDLGKDMDEMINIHSLDPIPGEGEIGGACSFVSFEDIIKIGRKIK